mgnify:CR=1 FL=1
MKYSKISKGMLYALIAMMGIVGLSAHATETYRSPLALATHGNTVYVAEFTAREIAVFDADKNSVTSTIPMPDEVNGLCVSPDGARLYVTVGGPVGQVVVINLKDNTLTKTYMAGHTPKGPVITPDGKTLFVCNQFNDAVMAIDLTGASENSSVPVSREPVAAAITPDGSRIFVANLLPTGRADGNYVTANVDVIDVATKKKVAEVELTNGSSSLLDVCVSPDGRYAYATHILSRYQLPTTQLERGWINTNAVSVIDVATMQLVNTFLLDDVDLGAANPWGVTCTDDGQWLCVAHSGTHEISVIDRAKLHEKLDAAVAADTANSVPNDLAFLVELRQRIKLPGKGPRGLATIGSRVFAAEYFSGTLASVDLTKKDSSQVQGHSLGDEPAMTVARAGELYFHNGAVCFQQWQSCASCHPGNARVDALNWDVLNDGMGNPKNTKSMLHAYDTPPTTATAVRDNAMVSTRAGIRFILFNQPTEEDALSVDEYLKSLEAVPSPRLVDGELSAAAQRGKQVFESAKCSKCHPAPLYTDMKTHKVGTNTRLEPVVRFDTPTLIEIWRTAPYLHDGRAATMKELISTHNESNFHGETADLTEAQVNDLVEYVLSL